MVSARPHRLALTLAAGAALVAAPAGSLAAASGSQAAQHQQTCPIPVVNADPDPVTLSGPQVLWPPDGQFVTYTLTAAETAGEKGDGLPHGVTISYSITTADRGAGSAAGASPATGSAQGDFSVPVRFRLQRDRAGSGTGRTYTINWSATFDGGAHTCSSTTNGNTPFVVVVPHDRSGAFHAQGILSQVDRTHRALTIDDTDGDVQLRGHDVTTYLQPATTIRRDGAAAPLSALAAGDRVTVTGSYDRHGRLQAATAMATSPPRPDEPGASVAPSCLPYYGACTPALPPATGGPTATITISNFVFDPPVAVLPAGTVVTVRNDDGFAHTFSANHLDSGDIPGGGSFTVAFTTPGVYRFFCAIHPFMNGVIEVR
jgi:plastocyanin